VNLTPSHFKGSDVKSWKILADLPINSKIFDVPFADFSFIAHDHVNIVIIFCLFFSHHHPSSGWGWQLWILNMTDTSRNDKWKVLTFYDVVCTNSNSYKISFRSSSIWQANTFDIINTVPHRHAIGVVQIRIIDSDWHVQVIHKALDATNCSSGIGPDNSGTEHWWNGRGGAWSDFKRYFMGIACGVELNPIENRNTWQAIIIFTSQMQWVHQANPPKTLMNIIGHWLRYTIVEIVNTQQILSPIHKDCFDKGSTWAKSIHRLPKPRWVEPILKVLPHNRGCPTNNRRWHGGPTKLSCTTLFTSFGRADRITGCHQCGEYPPIVWRSTGGKEWYIIFPLHCFDKFWVSSVLRTTHRNAILIRTRNSVIRIDVAPT